MSKPIPDPEFVPPPSAQSERDDAACAPEQSTEIGGRVGPDPTRYGDWEKNGRCIDF
ncbi:MAG: succinate dehydrogenase assembly factor 4 [Dokdonella sp.]|uniref:DUF1674 domain-containing protein n=1 Tax=Dokdonella sp. TaxID=2291710 RepID=UPI002B76B675|nr:succinate dehydrogenase assembly factor 4 [Dokdonella sp.]HOX71375.1 DUF1674 domain-containing protein [Dokdonella sp.]HPN79446.1 DUF1674 domain-containing protein [Dokdonella sp.]